MASNKQPKILDWARQYFESIDPSIVFNYQKIVDTAYSVVFKIMVNAQTFYLKQTPKDLFQEAKVLQFLNAQGINNIPRLLAANEKLNCFLMPSCGDCSLRDFFAGNIDAPKLKKGITNFSHIQRALENKNKELLELGLPDWSLSRFPALYLQLISDEKLLHAEGLSETEINSLKQLYPTCIELCEKLAAYKIPETIGHGDFHDNNMLLDKKTGDVNIIDWGEAVIVHPFFSLQSCLWSITYFYKVPETDQIYHELQAAGVSDWLNMHSEGKLLEALNIVARLNGIYAALSFARLYKATENYPRNLQSEKRGAVAGCLRAFIDASS